MRLIFVRGFYGAATTPVLGNDSLYDNNRTLDYAGLLDIRITVIVIQASIKGASRPHIIILKQEHTCYINMGRQTLLYILNLVSRFPQITSLGMPGHSSNIPYWGINDTADWSKTFRKDV